MNLHEDTGVHEGTDGAVRRYAGVLSKQERWYRSYGSIRIPSVMQSPRFTIRLLDAAIRSGHLSIVKLLVENGAQLGPVEGELINRTPLHIAAHCDNAEIAKYLLSSGADEAAKDDHSDTALDVAVKAAAVSCIWVLLRPSTASIHKKSTLEYFLVFFVSKTKEKYRWGPDGLIELQFQNSTQHMLEVGPGAPSTRNDVHTVCNEINGHGTPLLDTVQCLLDHGWDVDSKEGIAPLNRANTALSSACRWGMVDLIDLLLRNGANPNAGEHPAIHEACGSDESPIHVVENLIRHGADVNKRDYRDEMPLHYACQSLLLDKVKYLVHHGAKVDIYSQAHRHPLHIICGTSSNRENAAELLEFLLPLSDPGVLSADNVTPLMLAIECSRWKAAKLLTQQPTATMPKVTAMSKSLWRCARSGDVEGLEFLLGLGADPTTTGNEDLEQPIIIASVKDHYGSSGKHTVDIFERILTDLVNSGVDINDCWARDGTTALHKATNPSMDLNMVQILIEHGADPSIKDKDEKTPYGRAIEKENERVAAFLAEHSAGAA